MPLFSSRINEKIQRYDKLIKDILDPKLDTSDISDRFWYNSPSFRTLANWTEDRIRTKPSNSKDGVFRVDVDVHNFKLDDLEVKLADGFVTVEGKHEERPDEHGYVMRHFVRKFKLPDSIASEQVVSSLSSDGILSLTAPNVNVINTI
ncbi:heat shock protein 26-like [Cimex lectularius]|uniref:SHSP domain-containing protein n=1 Tax=Cimex lectularius TaxID=79782 RepID=A0A8I6S7C6_CIMLE|nr:heat shock protein 26-like [Cimex lectularius]